MTQFVADPVNTPPLTKFVLGATIVSIHVVGMTKLNDWITFVSTNCCQISATTASDILGEAELIEFDDAPFYGYPLVSFVV
jgi:hypothetical protein